MLTLEKKSYYGSYVFFFNGLDVQDPFYYAVFRTVEEANKARETLNKEYDFLHKEVFELRARISELEAQLWDAE